MPPAHRPTPHLPNIPAHTPHSPAVIQRFALLSWEGSQLPEYVSNLRMNMAEVAAARMLHRSPTLRGVPSEDKSTVPKKAKKALIQVGAEMLRPSSQNAKNGTSFTFRYSRNALRLFCFGRAGEGRREDGVIVRLGEKMKREREWGVRSCVRCWCNSTLLGSQTLAAYARCRSRPNKYRAYQQGGG